MSRTRNLFLVLVLAISVGTSTTPRVHAGEWGSMQEFAEFIVQDVNASWATRFNAWEFNYAAPAVLYVPSGTTAQSACSTTAGYPSENLSYNPAFYCVQGGQFGDQWVNTPVIYLSLPWLRDLWNQAGGDFAPAYVVAHEWGHHVEYLFGLLDPQTGRGCCGYFDEQLELWADCFAGVWGNSAYYEGNLEAGDVEEGQTAAWQLGSDLPNNYGSQGDHGTRQERLDAFMLGYNTGETNDCLQADLGDWYSDR